MDNEINNDLIASVIEQSMGKRPEELSFAFHEVAWSLPRWHLLMLLDKPRMDYYSEVIRTKVAGKIVLDVGTGSGILSHLALKWGAKKVYSVEQNPALQSVYRHLMRVPLGNGKAELICDDAQFLRLDQFPEGAPEVILHELFGSIGMGENLIPIFRALNAEGILTNQTILVPDRLEVWIRPVWSEKLSEEGQIQPFAEYPLNELNIFGSQTFWEQDYLASKASEWESKGDGQLLFACDLHDLKLPEIVSLSFAASKCSHLKLWMKIIDKTSSQVLINDHQEMESHWANAFLTIPAWLRGKDLKVEFKIFPNIIQVNRFF